jgi:hypothetical protein
VGCGAWGMYARGAGQGRPKCVAQCSEIKREPVRLGGVSNRVPTQARLENRKVYLFLNLLQIAKQFELKSKLNFDDFYSQNKNTNQYKRKIMQRHENARNIHINPKLI